MTEKNPHFGSSFEDFLQEEGIADEVNAAAIKHVLAWLVTVLATLPASLMLWDTATWRRL